MIHLLTDTHEAIIMPVGVRTTIVRGSPGASASVSLISADDPAGMAGFTRAQTSAGTALVLGPFTTTCVLGITAIGMVGVEVSYASAGAGSGDALIGNPLSQFAPTTSGQFAGVLTDETGSGLVVLNNAPTLIDPVVGTQAAGDNTGKGASTAFVQSAVAAGIAGLSWKQAARAATTANGTLASAYAAGQVIDGVTLATFDRILVKNQTATAENGIYTVNASGAPTRTSDADAGSELVNASVYVSEGTTNADTQWTCTTNAPITLGSTALAFAQLTSGGTPGLLPANNLSDLNNAATARTNLGLGNVNNTSDASKPVSTAQGAADAAVQAAAVQRANHTGSQLASTISDFTEAAQDVIGAMVAAAGGSYDDAGNAITLPGGSVTVQDEGGALATAAAVLNFVGAGVTASGTGGTKTITIPSGAAAPLTGIDVATTGAVVAGDTVLAGIGKLQATKVDASGSVDVSAVATLTTALHSNQHLYSTSDAQPVRSLPSSGQVRGHFIEYKNGGSVPHSFTGGVAAPGMTLIVNPGETIGFLYDTQWDSTTPANPATIPTAGDKVANYTTVLADAGKRIRHPASDANARTFTIDGTLAYPDGTTITFPNRTAQVLSLALVGGSGTLRLAGTTTTGTRAIAQHGYAVAMLDGGDWLASGPGVT